MCLPRAKGCCCRDRERLCQLEQGDALAAVFGAPHRARKGEGLKKDFIGAIVASSVFPPRLGAVTWQMFWSYQTQVLWVVSHSFLDGTCIPASAMLYCDPLPLTFEVLFAKIEEVGTLGAIGSCLWRETYEAFLCHRASVHTEILFDSPRPNCSLFFFSLNWFTWSKQCAHCLRVEAGPCTLPLCVTRSLKMFTIEELPLVAFSLFSACACNCCIIVCVCVQWCVSSMMSLG